MRAPSEHNLNRESGGRVYRAGWPQGQWLGTFEERDHLAQWARTVGPSLAQACAGIRPPSPAWDWLLFPGDSQKVRDDMRLQSSCALFDSAYMRLFGIEHDALRGPYKTGSAPANVMQVAQHYDAWHLTSDTASLLPGDLFVVEPPWHTGVVIEVHPAGDPNSIITVDGGQVCRYGASAIERCVRPVTASRIGARRLIARVDLLALAKGCRLSWAYPLLPSEFF